MSFDPVGVTFNFWIFNLEIIRCICMVTNTMIVYASDPFGLKLNRGSRERMAEC